MAQTEDVGGFTPTHAHTHACTHTRRLSLSPHLFSICPELFTLQRQHVCSARDMSHQHAQDGSEIDRDGKNNQQARIKIQKTKTEREKGRKRGEGWG